MSSADVLSLSGRMAAPGPLGRDCDWDCDWEWVGTWLDVCARCCDSGCGCGCDCDCDGVAAAANSLVAGSLGDVCDRDTKDDAVDR